MCRANFFEFSLMKCFGCYLLLFAASANSKSKLPFSTHFSRQFRALIARLLEAPQIGKYSDKIAIIFSLEINTKGNVPGISSRNRAESETRISGIAGCHWTHNGSYCVHLAYQLNGRKGMSLPWTLGCGPHIHSIHVLNTELFIQQRQKYFRDAYLLPFTAPLRTHLKLNDKFLIYNIKQCVCSSTTLSVVRWRRIRAQHGRRRGGGGGGDEQRKKLIFFPHPTEMRAEAAISASFSFCFVFLFSFVLCTRKRYISRSCNIHGYCMLYTYIVRRGTI